ncbi:hypothetical protein FO519_009360 [Halicephalobus sp. NKZ332]|nr:hypothetical protein FO519_009360 [Halicephalobus sp. NKZ332]
MPLNSHLCSYDGHGNGSILLMGNSYAMRHFWPLMKELKGNYRKLYLASQLSCTVFRKLNNPVWNCNYITSRYLEIMDFLRPDITIITQRVSDIPALDTPLSSFEAAKTDRMTGILREYWREYSNYTKQIIVVEPHPTFEKIISIDLPQMIRVNQEISSYSFSKEYVENQINPSWWRVLASLDDCDICSIVPIRHRFFTEEGQYDIIDSKTNLSLFCDTSHYSSVGSARIVPDVVKAINFDLLSG